VFILLTWASWTMLRFWNLVNINLPCFQVKGTVQQWTTSLQVKGTVHKMSDSQRFSLKLCLIKNEEEKHLTIHYFKLWFLYRIYLRIFLALRMAGSYQNQTLFKLNSALLIKWNFKVYRFNLTCHMSFLNWESHLEITTTVPLNKQFSNKNLNIPALSLSLLHHSQSI